MSKTDDGGPAFPTPTDPTTITGRGIKPARDGMTLRDWFAGQALARMVDLSMHSDGSWSDDGAAYGAYKLADAMLRQRRVSSEEVS